MLFAVVCCFNNIPVFSRKVNDPVVVARLAIETQLLSPAKKHNQVRTSGTKIEQTQKKFHMRLEADENSRQDQLGAPSREESYLLRDVCMRRAASIPLPHSPCHSRPMHTAVNKTAFGIRSRCPPHLKRCLGTGRLNPVDSARSWAAETK